MIIISYWVALIGFLFKDVVHVHVFLWHNSVAPGCTQPCFDNFLFVFNFTVFGFHTEHNFRRKSTSSIIHLQQAPHTCLILCKLYKLDLQLIRTSPGMHCTQVHARARPHKRIAFWNWYLCLCMGGNLWNLSQNSDFPTFPWLIWTWTSVN